MHENKRQEEKKLFLDTKQQQILVRKHDEKEVKPVRHENENEIEEEGMAVKKLCSFDFAKLHLVLVAHKIYI